MVRTAASNGVHAFVASRAARAGIIAPAIWGGAFLGSMVLTVAMVFDVRVGLALLVAVGFTVISLVSLPWGVSLWLVLAFLTGAFLPLFAALTAGAVVLLLAWFGELVRGGAVRPLPAGRRWYYVVTPVLVAWLLIGATWAEDPTAVPGGWLPWARSLAIFFVIATTLWRPSDLRLIAGAFVVGAVLSVALGLAGPGAARVHATGAVEEGRLTGGAGDPNVLAAGLLPALVLAIALAAITRGPLARALALVSVPVLVTGILLTQSRGALIGAIAVLVASLVILRRRRLGIIAATLGVTVLAAAGAAMFPDVLSRWTDVDAEGSGRSDLWTVAMRVAGDHPLVGVGLDNYPVVAPEYLRRPGSLTFVDLIADQPHVVHNTYLGLVAECGLIGLLLFLTVAILAVVESRQAAGRFAALRDAAGETLANAVLIGAVGMLTTAFFLSAGADPRMWVLLALGPALLSASRWRSEHRKPAPRGPAEQRA